MANICDQRVVIVASTDADMAECLEKMARNVLDGIVKDHYFKEEELKAASGQCDKIYELLKRCQGEMNLICFFAPEPDSRTESGWMGWRVEHEKDFPLIELDIGVKWGPSYDLGEFCEQLDPKRFAYSISDGGEYCEWEYVSIDGDWIEGPDVSSAVDKARKNKTTAKSMEKIAYWTNLAGISADLYGEIFDDE